MRAGRGRAISRRARKRKSGSAYMLRCAAVTPADDLDRTHYRLTFGILAIAGASFALLQSLVAPVLRDDPARPPHHATTVTWSSPPTCSARRWRRRSWAGSATSSGRSGCWSSPRRARGRHGGLRAGDAIGVMIAARVHPGLGGAVFPLAFGIIRDEFPRERVAARSASSSHSRLGAGLGIVLAGPIVETSAITGCSGSRWSWSLIAAAGAPFVIPESPVRAPGASTGSAPLLLAAWLVVLLVGGQRGTDLGLELGRVLGLLGGRRGAAGGLDRGRDAPRRAAGRHADDAPARRLDDQPVGDADRLRHVRLVRARAPVRADARLHRLRLRRLGDRGRAVPAPLAGGDARWSARWPASCRTRWARSCR